MSARAAGAAAVAVALFAGACDRRPPVSPEPPGERWRIGVGVSTSLYLQASGEFAARQDCDICMNPPIQRGRWRREGDWLTFAPPLSRYGPRLRAATIRGCSMLIPLEDGHMPRWIGNASVFVRGRDDCALRLDEQGGTGALLRELEASGR